MTRRIFCKVLLVVVAIFGLLVLSGVLLAQGRSEDAFDRVREVQERNTDWLMAIDGVEGTAIGLGQGARPVVLVLLEHGGVPGIPEELEGVPVRPLVTGKFYALAPPNPPPGQDKKAPTDRPLKPPRALTATAVGDNQIDLDWRDNRESDVSHYNVYRSLISGSQYTQINIDPALEVSEYPDTGLAASTTYYYVVTAVDEGGNESNKSDEASATTSGELGSPPEEPLDPTSRWPRPVPIGVSTGHPTITAGTIGCRVTNGTDVYALSNNHVYALENTAPIGDAVIQPGTFDGGSSPTDDIGTLFDFEDILFFTPPFVPGDPVNEIDAAIALSSTSLLGNATPSDGYGTPKSAPVAPEVGMTVMKYGRTTGQTKGRIRGINATVTVGYDSGDALFVNQIVISGGSFSAGGDSGSLIVVQKGTDRRKPVGLLFAGTPSFTLANPIGAVLDAFGVGIDGE